MGCTIDNIDKRIINIIQSAFPIASHPYHALGEQVGITEREAWERVNQLRSKGIIRRIGAIFDSQKLGFISTLIGVKADPLRVNEVAAKINVFSGLTHHYQRDDEYNLWFTLTARDQETIDGIIEEMRTWEGIQDILDLQATQTFKIKVDFQL